MAHHAPFDGRALARRTARRRLTAPARLEILDATLADVATLASRALARANDAVSAVCEAETDLVPAGPYEAPLAVQLRRRAMHAIAGGGR